MKMLAIISLILLVGCSNTEDPDARLFVNGNEYAVTGEEVNITKSERELVIQWKNHNSDVQFWLVSESNQLLIDKSENALINLGIVHQNVSEYRCTVDSSYVEIRCSVSNNDQVEIVRDISHLVTSNPQTLYLFMDYKIPDGIASTGARIFLN